MKKEPFVVAVVDNWNGLTITYKGRSITETCIESLKKTRYGNMKIIISDQGSKDGSVKYFSNKYRDIGISKAEDRGWGYGLNSAIDYAFRRYPDLEYIALLNNDLIFNDRNWLTKLVGAAEKDSSIGMVGCKLKYPTGEIQHGGAKITFTGGHLICDRELASRSRYTEFVVGSLILVKRDVFLKSGGLDETFLPFYCDETEWEARIERDGFKVYYAGNTDITHFHGYSLANSKIKKKWDRDQITYFWRRNYYIFFLRYKPWLLPGYFASDFVSNFLLIAPLRVRDAKTIRSRLGMQYRALTDALKTYKVYKVRKIRVQ